ncbi:MAG: bifunctional phosphoglucose/phosphomannose isomerase [Ignavibacteriota bacterium]
MSFTLSVTTENLASLDKADMGGAIAAMGKHLLDAAARSKKALDAFTLPQKSEIKNIVVAGLGGSAIGGDLVRSYLLSKLSVPFSINRTYDLPGFVDEHTLVIASSYSGSTEESLSMFEEASKRNAKIICITTGGKLAGLAAEHVLPIITLPTGFQPRAALAYSFVPVLLILEKLGFTSGEEANISDAANMLEQLEKQYGTSQLNESNTANALAQSLLSKIPVVYSPSDHFDTVNIRWRGQIQENGKHVAFGNVLPEMNHNEINGWDFPSATQDRFQVLFLRSEQDEHPQVTKRFGILHDVLTSKGVEVQEFSAQGNSLLARMFSLIALGDWTSYYLALLAGVDPSPVPVIMQLKSKLA